ncbi:MAG: SDR family NAD(P)-dependent oxidoreductase [Calditrichaeota bacterium]|nr:MAG: SDR family NAD(P)-dependent oxidoreductase [Calditrichota bacterium]
MSQNILITGSSSGFGLLSAQTLLEKGHTVIATMRDPESRNKEFSNQLKAKGAHIISIDVTDDSSVEKGVKDALAAVGHIDVLVNNAGVGVSGLQESFTIDDWKNLFDINVFGVQRMNRAILPHMRERKSGLLIHVSSLLGRFVLPFFGPYNASKYALEAMADNYRVELSAFGIESVLVEPGGFGTDFTARILKPADAMRSQSYGELANGPEQQIAAFEKNYAGENAPNPQMVADAIFSVIEEQPGKRPFRTVVDGLGMGDPIKQYNEAADKMTNGIYNAFGMADMLKIQK